MVLIIDENMQMRYDDLWYLKHSQWSVSSILPYIIGNDHVAKIMRFKNCTMNVEKKDTRYVTIERIMIHTSGVQIFLNVALFHMLTVFTTYVSDTILFE